MCVRARAHVCVCAGVDRMGGGGGAVSLSSISNLRVNKPYLVTKIYMENNFNGHWVTVHHLV